MGDKPITNRNRTSLMRKIYQNRYLLLMLSPGVIYLIINNYIPMLGSVVAFKSINYALGYWKSPWVGFDNFKFLFNSSDAWVITRNTILYNLVFIVLTLVSAVTFAILLNELRNRFFSNLYQSVMFLPYFLSAVVVGYLGYSMLSQEFGFINTIILAPLGIDPISWYSEPKYWPFILPIVYIWKNVGYSIVIYLAAIISIDKEYYEAAITDGATKWQLIRNITLPSIRPMMIILTLLAIGHILNADFGLFYQLPLDAGALYSTTNVIDTYVYRALLRLGDTGMSSAAGLYQSVVGFVLVVSVNFVVRRIDKENALF
ncbi:carbohydrate ABC transporter membrane protein 1 (CUT1 family) [Paenibacillus taihuensis]|uniref:Carbohydrate ABC transporter membrane protein 1 (CUT1 family) n=1 Tax=Paenibacillus taihuensis TaxID=1156355 RepID=A0A3D9S5A9_9BACL|nr:ABC transporter permease subunit [Paenibacillus taihuensis]REE87413.1 carbohydrate ABC transporter membrane protein 1 (CUT1 family) [Paenibacillus taihuensis]